MEFKIIEQEINNSYIEYLNNKDYLNKILNILDLTTLEGKDNEKKVKELCTKAESFNKLNSAANNVAAVCVYPTMVKFAVEHLQDKEIGIASVAGGFPSGQSPLNIRLAEVEYAVNEGANEIDMVISRGRFLEGDYDFIKKEVSETKKSCKDAHLKVILETGELLTPENITLASKLSIEAGADFIKTSTGKISPAATLESVFLMLLVIKEHHEKTGIKIGIKPAGGISDVETALKYYLLVEKVLGTEWLNKDLFRIGASRLADRVFEAFNK